MAEPQARIEQHDGIMAQLHRAWRLARTVLAVACVLFFVILAGEVLRIYQTAASVSPWLGYGVVALFAVLIVLTILPLIRFLRTPAAVAPPPLPDSPDEFGLRHLAAECRFLDRYLQNGLGNPELADKTETIANARRELAALHARTKSASESQVKELGRELTAWHDRHLQAVLKDLDKRVDRMIYQEALTVGLATAASPNGTLDAFVMAWRSMKLVSQIATSYYGRPGLWGTLAVCKDVSVATAMAGYLQNVSDSLGNLVAKSVGGATGVVAGPAVDGITNALVLIRIGYLAQERCRSTRRWNVQARKNALIRALASTQRVALGLSSEIVRQTLGGIGAVAGAVAGGIASAAVAAKDGVVNAAVAAKEGVVNAAGAAKQGVATATSVAWNGAAQAVDRTAQKIGQATESIAKAADNVGWRARLRNLQFWKRA